MALVMVIGTVMVEFRAIIGVAGRSRLIDKSGRRLLGISYHVWVFFVVTPPLPDFQQPKIPRVSMHIKGKFYQQHEQPVGGSRRTKKVPPEELT